MSNTASDMRRDLRLGSKKRLWEGTEEATSRPDMQKRYNAFMVEEESRSEDLKGSDGTTTDSSRRDTESESESESDYDGDNY